MPVSHYMNTFDPGTLVDLWSYKQTLHALVFYANARTNVIGQVKWSKEKNDFFFRGKCYLFELSITCHELMIGYNLFLPETWDLIDLEFPQPC